MNRVNCLPVVADSLLPIFKSCTIAVFSSSPPPAADPSSTPAGSPDVTASPVAAFSSPLPFAAAFCCCCCSYHHGRDAAASAPSSGHFDHFDADHVVQVRYLKKCTVSELFSDFPVLLVHRTTCGTQLLRFCTTSLFKMMRYYLWCNGAV